MIFIRNGAYLARLAAALVILTVSACSTTPPPPRPAPPPLNPAGLERVLGKDAPALVALFGDPDLDIREGTARKYQFAGPLCVLDVYLYPPQAGGIPVASYVEARTLTGQDFDRASCLAALVRRPQAR